jgi:hypothetical protein
MKFFLKCTFFFALFFVFACKRELIGTNGSGLGSILGSGDCAYSINYDAEVTMTKQPVNAADMNRLTAEDKVGLLPHTTRSAVEFCMKGNGSSEWVIEKMKPRQVFEAKSYALPDPSPKAKIIRIVNDRATFIDSSGNVIRNAAFKVNELTAGLNSLMNLAKNGNTESDFNKMLEDARKVNAEIVDMGEGLFRITKSMPNSSDMMSVMVDKVLGRVVSNAILTGLGKPKYMVNYIYEKTDTPILKTVIQRSFNTSPHGIEMKSEKVVEFIKLDISGKIPNKTDGSTIKN